DLVPLQRPTLWIDASRPPAHSPCSRVSASLIDLRGRGVAMNLYAAGRGASRLRASMRSNRGRSHERNEDASLVDLGRGPFVVADGVSGNRGGVVAARVVIDRLPGLLDAARSAAWADLDSAIQRAVVDLGGVVRAEARSSPDLTGMAMTVVMLM